jgi:hypothetical protein
VFNRDTKTKKPEAKASGDSCLMRQVGFEKEDFS